MALGAITDFETSARFAVGNIQSYGQSLWASLQAAEKTLKFFIAAKGGNFPQIHDLTKLTTQAYSLGLPRIDENLLKTVQCKAGVRYEQSKETSKRSPGTPSALSAASSCALAHFAGRFRASEAPGKRLQSGGICTFNVSGERLQKRQRRQLRHIRERYRLHH